MASEHVQYIQLYMRPFANVFMQERYREDCVDLALARYSDCFAWSTYFSANNIPFEHAILIYTLTFTAPWSYQVRQTANGFVSPEIWIKDNYYRFQAVLDGYDEIGVPPQAPGQYVPYDYTFLATSYGEQVVTFSSAPIRYDLYINGLKQNKSSCVLSSVTLTIPATYAIHTGDTVSVSFFLEVIGGSASGGSTGSSGGGGNNNSSSD